MNTDVTRYPADTISTALAQFPTPFFLYEQDRIEYWLDAFESAFAPLFPGFTPLFAVKANPNPHVLKVITEKGWGFDCSSAAEVELSKKLGNVFSQHTGNYSTEEELKMVLEADNVLLNLDDISQLEAVQKIGVPEYLSFRINPGIGTATMESNVLAGPNAKYGVPREKAVEAYKKAKELGVKRFGIHMMTGSNVDQEDYFSLTTATLLDVCGLVKQELGIEFEYLNVGGGFNVPYHPEEQTFDLQKIAKQIRSAFDEKCAEHGLQEPKLMIEPGRRVTCDAGFLVASVTNIKDGYKKFVGINVSSNAMPRPSIYEAYHHISVLGKEGSEESVNITGSICENCDQFAKDRELPVIDERDTIVIHNCGAHAAAMAHNYNGKLQPAEILVKNDGTLEQIRRSQTIDDLFVTYSDF